jgi:phosphoglycerate dehydrogenase-like enzyme
LRERVRGTPLHVVEVDPDRPLEEQVGEAVALIPSMGRITAAVIAAAPRLKLIVQYGAGLEGVDREAAEARGIPVRNVAGANAQAVGELALFLMLALARRLPEHRRSFASRVVGDPVGTELLGKTVGIVGLGASGRSLARMARGLGMRVIALRRNAGDGKDPDADWVGSPGDLGRLLAEADYVTLHLPTTPETVGMIDAARLAKMKPSAFLINVGRGGLVDRAALVEALRERRIRGAGLDVYWDEPPDPADPLLAMDNVVATPHIGGTSEEAMARLADRVAAILREFLLGEVPRG